MKFISSIITAIVSGVAITLGGILFVNYIDSHFFTKVTSIKSEIVIENEEDPTFISHLSRGVAYSAEDDVDAISGIFGNLPASAIESQDNQGSNVKNNTTKISAKAYSVTDIDRDVVVFEHNAEQLLPIASITKLVTAVVAKKLLDPDHVIQIGRTSFATEGNSGKLRLDETFKLKEILYPLLMVSSNDVAEAISASYGRKDFIKEMNTWVNSIGAYRTYFSDPSGLSANNKSTARDISIILKWIKIHEPDIFDITLTREKTIRTHTWVNPTHFLSLASYEGGKNGYTTEANRTTASLFSFGSPKRHYSVVLLGGNQRDSDVLAVINEAFK